MNLASIVAANAKTLMEKPAIISASEVVTYEELGFAIRRIAEQLYTNGARERDCVGLAMRDHATHLIAHYAIASLGAIIVPIDHRWAIREQESIARSFGTKFVITDGDSYPGVRSLTVSRNPATVLPRLPVMPDTDSLDLLISLSSGTTGTPSGAYVTHRQMYERFISQWVSIGFDSNDCFALVTPLYFGAGRSFGMSMLAAGGTVRIAPPPHEYSDLAELLGQSMITATFLPPTMLRKMFAFAPGNGKWLFPNLRYLVVSGEPLHRDEALECRRTITPNLFGYYASSEGGGICVLKPGDREEDLNSVGRPIFRTEVQVTDLDGKELPNGSIGRLRYRGPGMSNRFINREGTEQLADQHGWFYPGDLAMRLDSGHIALCGRFKDVIIRGGVNIYPVEIEAVLMEIPGIAEAAVVGSESKEKGQRIIAFIAAAVRPDTAQIAGHCRLRLAPYKIPEEFIYLHALPRLPSGKVDKKLLEKEITACRL